MALKCVSFFAHDQITTNIQINSSKPLVISLSDAYRSEFVKKVNL